MIFLTFPDKQTEDSVLTGLQNGDKSAVDAAYEAYFAPVYHYTRLKVGDPVLAEDIVSDVFVQLVRVAGTAAAPSQHLRGWLFTVARHQIASHIGRSRQITLTELEEWMPANNPNPEDRAITNTEIDRVRRAIRTLNEDHQEVLILRLGQRLSLKETADIMGRTVGAIKSLQFRALDNLRNLLTEGVTSV